MFQMDLFRRRSLRGTTGILAIVVLAALWVHRGPSANAALNDYHAGQRALVRHDLIAAAADFRRASDLANDPDRRAWAQYQWAECLKVQPSKRTQAIAALRSLVQDEPRHFLAARAKTELDRLQGRTSHLVAPPALEVDCGPEALAYILQHSFNRPASLSTLRRLAGTNSQGTTLFGLLKAVPAGLKAEGMKVDMNYLRRMPPPAILWIRRSHYIAYLGTKPGVFSPFWKFRVYDPAGTREEVLTPEELQTMWDGYLLKLSVPHRA